MLENLEIEFWNHMESHNHNLLHYAFAMRTTPPHAFVARVSYLHRLLSCARPLSIELVIKKAEPYISPSVHCGIHLTSLSHGRCVRTAVHVTTTKVPSSVLACACVYS